MNEWNCCIGIKNVHRIKLFIKTTHKIKNKYIYKITETFLNSISPENFDCVFDKNFLSGNVTVD